MKLPIQLTRHAQKRLRERQVSLVSIREAANKASDMLSLKPVSFSHAGLNVVAKKSAKRITIITAWPVEKGKAA